MGREIPWVDESKLSERELTEATDPFALMKQQASRPKGQVGGSHYDGMPIEPIEYIEANSLSYHEANVIKYVSRWKAKGGISDLRKAIWYIERLIELESE